VAGRSKYVLWRGPRVQMPFPRKLRLYAGSNLPRRLRPATTKPSSLPFHLADHIRGFDAEDFGQAEHGGEYRDVFAALQES